jgi:hypothetical protein
VPRKTYSHHCRRCYSSYYSYESDKYYCSSACEGRDNYDNRYPNQQDCKKRYLFKEPKVEKEPINQIAEDNKKWLSRKPLVSKRRQDLKEIMYADTFPKYIPKRLKVMRG